MKRRAKTSRGCKVNEWIRFALGLPLGDLFPLALRSSVASSDDRTTSPRLNVPTAAGELLAGRWWRCFCVMPPGGTYEPPIRLVGRSHMSETESLLELESFLLLPTS